MVNPLRDETEGTHDMYAMYVRGGRKDGTCGHCL